MATGSKARGCPPHRGHVDWGSDNGCRCSDNPRRRPDNCRSAIIHHKIAAIVVPGSMAVRIAAPAHRVVPDRPMVNSVSVPRPRTTRIPRSTVVIITHGGMDTAIAITRSVVLRIIVVAGGSQKDEGGETEDRENA